MATSTTENGDQTGFDAHDAETVRKLVAMWDSNAEEADTAFRKIVLVCAKKGMPARDAMAAAFGQDDEKAAQLEADNAELRERLEQREEHTGKLADALERAKETIAMLREDRREGRNAGFTAWFRYAWLFPQFRLLALTAWIMAGSVALRLFVRHPAMVRLFLAVVLWLFVVWSMAQCRKQRIGQMLMKWVVYCPVVLVGCFMLPPSPALLMVLLAAMVLTLSKLSEWLSEQVRTKLWESNPVQVVRGWF